MSQPTTIITKADLFALRAAAAEWLRANPTNPNAPAVRQSLLDTNPPERKT